MEKLENLKKEYHCWDEQDLGFPLEWKKYPRYVNTKLKKNQNAVDSLQVETSPFAY